ncbi:MAG: hypothetical protein ACPL3C_03595 [Pyrobaculum sp.]
MNWLFVFGTVLVVAGVLLLVLGSAAYIFMKGGVKSEGGVVGCVVVFFVPVCFGAGSESAVAMGLVGLAALIAAVLLLQWLFWRRREAAAGG